MPDPPPHPDHDESGPHDSRLRLAPGVFVHDSDLTYRAVRSAGPGGQNVNKRSTKVELRVHIDDIPLPRGARPRLTRLAASRITDAGEIIITADEERSQRRNREAALARLRELVARALVPPKPRKPTRPTRTSIERRIREKKQRAETKRLRRKPRRDDT